MNLERLIQMVLRVVIARGVGFVVNRAVGWMQRRGRVGGDPAGSGGAAGKGAAPAQPTAQPTSLGLDAKRLRKQMRMISRIGRMR